MRVGAREETRLELKIYFDYKSPYAYLAMEPAFALPDRYDVSLRFLPFTLRIKGKGERSTYSEWKARYSYMDARRWANRRGGFTIRGPKKVYDSSPALIGGLFAQREGFFERYSLEVFRRFFEHRLEIDEPDAVAAFVAEIAGAAAAERDFLDFLVGSSSSATARRRSTPVSRRPTPTTCSACRCSASRVSSSGDTTASRCSRSASPSAAWRVGPRARPFNSRRGCAGRRRGRPRPSARAARPAEAPCRARTARVRG